MRNEDGLGGLCDLDQHLRFALSLWNGRDPILKERMFGLSGPEGNHGEDVKEYYFWRDLIPFHEYFHGDTGRGCGASHQKGWTGLIAQILMNLEEHAAWGAQAPDVTPALR